MGSGHRAHGAQRPAAMTPLGEKLVRLISATGPIPVSDYMAHCLFDPHHGYYTTREPFGAEGDFTTAPEISQMFGELVAIWLYNAWTFADRPDAPVLAEIGPGRGTLMRDIVRTLVWLDPGFVRRTRFELVETSPRLREIQRTALAESLPAFAWHDSVETLPDGPLFIVGNELFDAIPIRQFVKLKSGWSERMVGLGEDGSLQFVAAAAGVEPAGLPADAAAAPEGAIFEVAPAREALMDVVAERIARGGGAGLFIDYGHVEAGLGDTLQAVGRHRYVDPLQAPGEVDLTTHVDFAALAAIAVAHGLDHRLVTQGDFLLETGLLERAGSLGASADERGREAIRGQVERLAGPDGMGTLFKVLTVARPAVVRAPDL
jgi:SAM-dependent MidA family methyltransferase